MSSLTHLEKRHFEEMFGMSSGYVLDFSDRTYSDFFREVVNKDIYSEKYSSNGHSKAKRLRSFWDIESDMIVGKLLEQMLAVWAYNQSDKNATASTAYLGAHNIILRLLGKPIVKNNPEEAFLSINFSKISISTLPIEPALTPILETRLKEVNICLKSGAPLAAILLAGSIFEGLLLGAAIQNPKEFNSAKGSPKDDNGKVRSFQHWSLAQFIDIACEIGLLKLDIKKFSHSLRDFRNYIHPYAQMASGFNPDKHTAEICLQVLKAAIADLCRQR